MHHAKNNCAQRKYLNPAAVHLGLLLAVAHNAAAQRPAVCHEPSRAVAPTLSTNIPLTSLTLTFRIRWSGGLSGAVILLFLSSCASAACPQTDHRPPAPSRVAPSQAATGS